MDSPTLDRHPTCVVWFQRLTFLRRPSLTPSALCLPPLSGIPILHGELSSPQSGGVQADKANYLLGSLEFPPFLVVSRRLFSGLCIKTWTRRSSHSFRLARKKRSRMCIRTRRICDRSENSHYCVLRLGHSFSSCSVLRQGFLPS